MLLPRCPQDEAVKEYHALRLSLAQLARKLRDHVMRPDRCLPFLLPGRLVRLPALAYPW